MTLYRLVIGWTTRILLLPVLIGFFLLWCFLSILESVVVEILRVAEKLEEWERPPDDWKPMTVGSPKSDDDGSPNRG